MYYICVWSILNKKEVLPRCWTWLINSRRIYSSRHLEELVSAREGGGTWRRTTMLCISKWIWLFRLFGEFSSQSLLFLVSFLSINGSVFDVDHIYRFFNNIFDRFDQKSSKLSTYNTSIYFFIWWLFIFYFWCSKLYCLGYFSWVSMHKRYISLIDGIWAIKGFSS